VDSAKDIKNTLPLVNCSRQTWRQYATVGM